MVRCKQTEYIQTGAGSHCTGPGTVQATFAQCIYCTGGGAWSGTAGLGLGIYRQHSYKSNLDTQL